MDKFSVIKKYIDKYDYYSLLEHGAPDDEFDSYSRELAEVINVNATVEEIADMIAEAFFKGFGHEVPVEKYMETAKSIKHTLLDKSFS